MAYLEITLNIPPNDRPAAAGVYNKYKEAFLKSIKGARSKDLLVRDDDVQVLHGFATTDDARAYLDSALFNQDVVVELKRYMQSAPDVRIYDVI